MYLVINNGLVVVEERKWKLLRPGLYSSGNVLNFTLCIALCCVVGLYSWLVPLSKGLYHTCFIRGQGCKRSSRRLKLTLSVISDVKPIIYSTETAVLKIHNDILASMDAGKVTALTLLDLSTAFNTIDNTILLGRLDDWFEVTGKAHDWFKSYLTGRCQRIIRLGDCLSSKADLKTGVPQGSILGPLPFTLYTNP